MQNKELKNVYAKLQRARVLLQEKDLKKSGKNTFSKYNYFELSDFLPHINAICDELGLFTYTDITNEIALLNIINTDNEKDSVVFSIPSAAMELKGGNAIQNIGAVQTYMRRYLYMSAFEIAESDIIDQQAATSSDKKDKKGSNNEKEESNDSEFDDLMEEANKLKEEIGKSGKRAEINKIIQQKVSTPNLTKVTNKEDLKFIIEEFKKIK